MSSDKVRVGQVRRWSMENAKHSAFGLVFRVKEIDRSKRGVPYVHGTYLKHGEHPEVTKETSVQWTSASVDYMLQRSALVEDPIHFLDVYVSRKDIDEGQCEDPFNCAVARAITRAASKRWRRWQNVRATVTCNAGIRRDEKDQFGQTVERRVLTCKLPAEARNFVGKFDTTPFGLDRKDLKPFKFRIDVGEKFVGRPR